VDQQTPDLSEGNWYYIIVQDPGKSNEQFVGFRNPEDQEKFLPAFKTKDQAQACFALMPKDLFNGNYDTQAVIEEDLLSVAEDAGYQIYLLDGKGTILAHLNQ
jgi:hypothetical protein